MPITYRDDYPLTAAEFADVLQRSTLAARRPVDDPARLAQMLQHADLTITALDGDLVVGVARAITDWSYCCYLSDLAVDAAYQRQGIGRALVAAVQATVGETSSVILIAAPAAADYYAHIGFEKIERAWMLPRQR